MKRIVSYLIFALLLFSCDENKKPEVIDTTDINYHMVQRNMSVNIEWNFKSPEWEMVRDLLEKHSVKEPEKYQKPGFTFSSVLYHSEKGELDKIVITESISKEVDKSVVNFLKTIKKVTYLNKDDKPVKSHAVFTFNYNAEGLNFFPRIYNLMPPPPPPSLDDIYFVAVDEMPSIIDGLKAIQEKIVYPQTAKNAGIEGKVYVLAFIDETGTVAKAQIIKGIGGGCDEAAINAVLKTKFNPGKQKGKPVKVQVSIPILFKLN